MINIRPLLHAGFLTGLFLIAPLASADVPAWKIVPSKSNLSFTATQNNAPVTGTFKSFTGDINADPAQLAQSKIRIVVDMNSVSTAYADVANTLKTADWFNVKIFPTAVFVSNQLVNKGNNHYEAIGTLTIQNKTSPVELDFNLTQYSLTRAQVKGSTTLKRSVFNLGKGEWANNNAVKDNVQVNFTLTTVKSA